MEDYDHLDEIGVCEFEVTSSLFSKKTVKRVVEMIEGAPVGEIFISLDEFNDVIHLTSKKSVSGHCQQTYV